MSETLQIRQKNPEESEKMANLEEPDNDVYGYLSREVADALGEYIELTISEDGATTVTPQKSTKNFGVYESSGGAIVGMGISKQILSDVFGESDDIPQEVGITVAASTQDDYEDAEGVDEDEVDALLAGADGGSDDAGDSDEEEEEVGISDEELDLLENEQ